MKKIKEKLSELVTLLEEYKATSQEQRSFTLIKSYVSLAQNAASFKSRVKTDVNPKEQAAKLNKTYKDYTPEPKPTAKKKRGRPKKKENVLASSTDPKTLTEKLKND
jgi:hypothetical protein